MSGRGVGALMCFAALTLSIGASAQPRPLEATPYGDADALFREGKRLLEAGRVGAACEQLAASDRLEAAVGTHGLLAACLEKQGKLASAWRAYLETARRAAAANDKRERFARDKAAAIEPQVPFVTIRFPEPEPDAEVLLNGRKVDEIDLAAAVDPGPVFLVARSAGAKERRLSFELAPGARMVVDIPAPVRGEGVTTQKVTPTPVPPPAPSPLRPAAFAAGGVALAALLVGAGAGVAALSLDDEKEAFEEACDPAAQATDPDCLDGRDAQDGARTAAVVSTVGFAVAGVAAAGAVVLWLLAPDETEEPPRITAAPLLGPRGVPAGASLSVRF